MAPPAAGIALLQLRFPPQLQQQLEKWASSQGISTEQFVLLIFSAIL